MIRVRGARTHNLHGIDLDIPRGQLVVFTGPSGSGKSSLAFDTLHAEGIRQYMETLSAYARQFLEQVPRPDVDEIDGLPPTLCIDQRPGSPNPRSTVATVTETYDYLRLLMARLGKATCFQCGQPIRPQTVGEIVERLQTLPPETRALILAPLVRGRLGDHREQIDRVRRKGLVRVRIDGVMAELDHESPPTCRDLDAVVDRVVIRPGGESRLMDSVRLAVELSAGLVSCCYFDESGSGGPESAEDDTGMRWREETFSTLHVCPGCGTSFGELEPRSFSFNSPHGACPACQGLGTVETFDPALVVPDRSLSWATSAVAPWRGKPGAPKEALASVRHFLTQQKMADDQPWSRLSSGQERMLWQGDGASFPGLLTLLQQQWATAANRATLGKLTAYRGIITCQACGGSRLRPEANSVTLEGHSIHQIVSMSVERCRAFFADLRFSARDRPVADPIVDAIRSRLEYLWRVGLSYLLLNRSVDTLSGGEFQRVRLASSIGSGLVGVGYILDEPSIGLHQRDNQRLLSILRNLQSQGNSLLVVEHDEELIRAADWLIDLGPGAGQSGGRVVAEGRPDAVAANAHSLTGDYLSGRCRVELPERRRPMVKSRALQLLGVQTHNLQNVDLLLPLELFVCVTGVSGSGKSSLLHQTLAPALLRRLGAVAPTPGPFRSLRGGQHISRVVDVNQSPLGLSPRSNIATFTGIFDDIRKVFARTPLAKQRGYRAGRFSFNNAGGRCESCGGQGLRKIEMNFLPDLLVTCDTCRGTRFHRTTLEVRYRGHSIADVLALSVREAASFFQDVESVKRVLDRLDELGLGYMALGQPATTMSGGEAQRVKLATELAGSHLEKTLYLLDEPTTGLHFDDTRRLIGILQRLVDAGHSVVVVEHNLDVVKSADWIIDLGPEAGESGGRIVAEGTPEHVANCQKSVTGKYLAPLLVRD